MANNRIIATFAVKWRNRFNNEKSVTSSNLLSPAMASECESLGFTLEHGKDFEKKYHLAATNFTSLQNVIFEIDDINLLGSAIYYKWNYFLYWESIADEITYPNNREWFTTALDRLYELSVEAETNFFGTPTEININTNIVGYRSSPKKDEEVAQSFTIYDTGEIELHAYKYGELQSHYIEYRSNIHYVSPQVAQSLLDKISNTFRKDRLIADVHDTGTWQVNITNSLNETYSYNGTIETSLEIDGLRFSEFIRNELDMQDLFLLDYNYQLNRIEKFKIKIQGSDKNETKKASQILTINREQGFVENKIFNTAKTTTTGRFENSDEISEFLDSFNANYFLLAQKKSSSDSFIIPNSASTYTIEIETSNHSSQILTGVFVDIQLPVWWNDFARKLSELLYSYNNRKGDILDSRVYNRNLRRQDQYIICGVMFENGYKEYDYLSDDDIIDIDDTVKVPVGSDGATLIGTVTYIDYVDEEDLPLPLEQLKKIIEIV